MASVGPGTTRELASRGVPVHLTAEKHTAEGLFEALPPAGIAGRRFLLPRAEEGRDVLPEAIRREGGEVVSVVAYRNGLAEKDEDVAAEIVAVPPDVCTFASPSAFRNLFLLLGEEDAREMLAEKPDRGDRRGDRAGRPGAGISRWTSCPKRIPCKAMMDAIEAFFARREVTDGVFPEFRPRRLRRNETLRRMVRETKLSVDDLICPLFAAAGKGIRREVPSMPGVFNLSVENLVKEAREVARLGIPAVLLFGIPAKKDPLGKDAYSDRGIVQTAVRALKDAVPGPHGDHGRLPLRVHRPRPLRDPERDARSTTTPPSSSSRRAPSPTRAPAPTSWRPPT